MGKLEVDLHPGCRCTFEYWQLKRRRRKIKRRRWWWWRRRRKMKRSYLDNNNNNNEILKKVKRRESVAPCAWNGHGYRGWESSPWEAYQKAPRSSVRPACGESTGGLDKKNKKWDKNKFLCRVSVAIINFPGRQTPLIAVTVWHSNFSWHPVPATCTRKKNGHVGPLPMTFLLLLLQPIVPHSSRLSRPATKWTTGRTDQAATRWLSVSIDR